jgi:hypothetical protein
MQALPNQLQHKIRLNRRQRELPPERGDDDALSFRDDASAATVLMKLCN